MTEQPKETLLFEHVVTVDKYTKVILSIPKELDALELKAITTKANKLFSMSEIQLPGTQEQPVRQFRRTAPGKTPFLSQPENVNYLKELAENETEFANIVQKYNSRFNLSLTKDNIYQKIYVMKKKGIVTKEGWKHGNG